MKAPSFGSGSEFDLIRRLAGSPGSLTEGVRLGPGDDCAVLEGGVVISSDLSVEDIHFRREWITLQEAGYRAAAGALSDLAAMAAEPITAKRTVPLHSIRPRRGSETRRPGSPRGQLPTADHGSPTGAPPVRPLGSNITSSGILEPLM